ncbi:TPA: hypothetical protein DCZ39_05365 [Patescibacteria group bacterium]|nr:hypothetical protein [Candidatus Gracilibacteria bacterium]
MNTKQLSRANMLNLHAQSKFNIPLTSTQKDEFFDLAEGTGQFNEINSNRKEAGEPPLYETRDAVLTIADLELAREMN